MPFGPPNLDTRTFDDLVGEAKQRIPRYLPEWTDLNESDPGIALVELFAWMTEATLYELNRAPDALRLKLLELLGFTTRPAQPARTELQFTLTGGVDSVIIPMGTQVAASGATHPDGSPVIFETDAAVVAIGPVLTGAFARKAGAFVEFFSDPSAAPKLPFEPFPTTTATAVADDGLYLCFVYRPPFPTVDVDLALFLDESPSASYTYDCPIGDPLPPPAAWQWQYFAGGSTGWSDVELLDDTTAALYRSGHVRFRFPGVPASAQLLAGAAGVDPAYQALVGFWVRAQLTSASYEDAPRVVAVTTNTAPATQALTVRSETVGGSYGTASQVFTLQHQSVLTDSLEIAVDEGVDGLEVWTRVDGFYGSTKDAHVYTLDAASGQIGFGDNHFGAIPIANPKNQNNIVASQYRYGGGTEGNVAAALVTDLQTYVAYVDKVTNPIAAQGGADAESDDETGLRAGYDVRATNRAVTADDFSILALETPGAFVARAQALALTDPAHLGIEVPGSVTVVVIPRRREDVDITLQTASTPPPRPNRTTLTAVCAWLDAHRLVTTELHVTGPTYRVLTFAMTVYCRGDADLAAVSTTISTELRALYAPVGPDGGWTWGQTAYPAVAFAKAMDVDGVTRVDGFTMAVDGAAVDLLGNVPLGPTELFWVPYGGVQLTPRYEVSS